MKELNHGILVSKLARALGEALGLDENTCYELSVAGLLHDIGKLQLVSYLGNSEEDENPLVVQEVKFVRMHSELGYNALKEQGYSDFILDCVHYHHENYDGSGYPSSLRGTEIPLGARIIRICDMFAALRSDRPYSRALDTAGALRTTIDEVRFFDMEVFLAFQNVVHHKNYEAREFLHI
ncbi:MAG: HD domain-containing protein [Clostridiales bacterium]|nr:HD domain-containing protein [Candidatus Blautia equi]